MSKTYYVSLYPTPGYFRHFVIAAENPVKAIHAINYAAREAYKLHLKEDPKDTYRRAQRAKDIITTTRRYKRTNVRNGSSEPKCKVAEVSFNFPMEGHLNIACIDTAYLWNILPAVPLP